MEALRLQLDSARLENQRLVVENARLREERPERAADADAQAETAAWRGEIERLGAELAEVRQRLHDSQEREARASEDAEITRARLQEVEQSLQQQIAGNAKLIEQLRADMEPLETHCCELEAQISRLVTEADTARRDAELERLRALETERQKWEAREERLVEQLREAQKKSHLGRVQFESQRGIEASPMLVSSPEPTRAERVW